MNSFNGLLYVIILFTSFIQGDSDEFLLQILHPENLIAAAGQSPHHVKLTLRMQPGYNHSYFFVQSFIGDHIAHHAKILCPAKYQDKPKNTPHEK